MSFKFNLLHLLIIIIFLCIFYFAYHYYYEKKTQENFENNDYQGLSAYYKDSVNSNDIQNYLLPRWSTKKLQDSELTSQTVLSGLSDPWTGTFTNFDLGNTTPLATDTFCVIRKLGDKILFTIGLRSMQNSNISATSNDISTISNPYYTIQGTAKIERSMPNGNTINYYATVEDASTSTTSPANNGLLYLPVNGDQIQLSVTVNQVDKSKSYNLYFKNNNVNRYTFDKFTTSNINKGTLSNDGSQSSNYFNYDNEIIQPFYIMNTSVNNSTQFTDLNCQPGKRLCTFENSTNDGNTYYGCATDNSDFIDSATGACKFPSSDVSSGTISSVCTLNSSTVQIKDSNNSNANVSVCVPFYNLNIGGYDFMLNKIMSDESSSGAADGKLLSCQFIKNMPKTYNYLIMYFYDKQNFSNLSFQYWGESSNESRLLTVKNELNTAFSKLVDGNTFKNFINTKLSSLGIGTTDNTVYTSPSVKWELNTDLGNLSCYFSIYSKPVNTKPSYYIQAQPNGTLNMTLLDGGFDKYFTLLNVSHSDSNTGNIRYFAGDLRSSNGLYLSPGNSSITELTPVSGTNERVCTLVSTPPSGKWVIIGYQSSVTNPLA